MSDIIYKNGLYLIDAEKLTAKLIDEFLDDLKKRDDKIDCEYRCADEPCESCTNYHYCDDCSYILIEKWKKWPEK